jgi:hypothetical protein
MSAEGGGQTAAGVGGVSAGRGVRWQPTCEGWRREGPGWWVMEGVGGICRESDGRWWFYPADDGERVGPFRTLSYAIARVRATGGTQ